MKIPKIICDGKVICDGKTRGDCVGCGKWSSWHNLYYSHKHKKMVTEVKCCVGANRVFDDSDGKLIEVY